MVMYARSDELEIKCEARPGTSHVRPHKTKDPLDGFVETWGVDCKPCERGHLKTNPHWAPTRHRIPLTPDEQAEAEAAIQDAARMDAQIKLMEARERSRQYRELAASGELDQLAGEPVITTASDVVSGGHGEAGDELSADAGASYRGLTVKDLQSLARDRGLQVSGTKDELVARHTEYDGS